jgi:hypothetical protein
LKKGNVMATAPVLETTVPMAQEWKDLLEELLPRQGCWSEEEYLVLTDHRNRMVEFTDGVLEVLPPPTDRHQSVLAVVLLAFDDFIETRGGKVQFAPLRLRIRAEKFREPDLLLLLSAADPRRQNRFWLGADLALEVVSEEKPERDLAFRNTGSSTRKPKPSRFFDCAMIVMKKPASIDVASRRCRCF